MGVPYTLSNGDIQYPHSESTPGAREGYTIDANDPYRLHLALPDCTHREQKRKRKRSCGCMKTVIWCKAFRKEVRPVDCQKCEYA